MRRFYIVPLGLISRLKSAVEAVIQQDIFKNEGCYHRDTPCPDRTSMILSRQKFAIRAAAWKHPLEKITDSH
jgi:hypothetical protein